jgi:hypothetical protein
MLVLFVNMHNMHDYDKLLTTNNKASKKYICLYFEKKLFY